MEPRISLVTLGVADPDRSRRFYEALGWTDARTPDDEIVFFQAGPLVLALWRRDRLTEQNGLPDGGGGGYSIAHNVGSPDEVDAILAAAAQAGGTVTKPAERAEWGGYSGTFSDPDGHPWEIAHNPAWTLTADGALVIEG